MKKVFIFGLSFLFLSTHAFATIFKKNPLDYYRNFLITNFNIMIQQSSADSHFNPNFAESIDARSMLTQFEFDKIEVSSSNPIASLLSRLVPKNDDGPYFYSSFDGAHYYYSLPAQYQPAEGAPKIPVILVCGLYVDDTNKKMQIIILDNCLIHSAQKNEAEKLVSEKSFKFFWGQTYINN